MLVKKLSNLYKKIMQARFNANGKGDTLHEELLDTHENAKLFKEKFIDETGEQVQIKSIGL